MTLDILVILMWLWWLQPAATSAATGASTSGAAASSGADSLMGCGMNPLIMLAMFGVMWFMLIRPENKRREEQEKLLKSLSRGAKVRTSSGILGEIVSLTDREVVLAIADKVRINVLRSQIAGIEPDSEELARIASKGSAKPASEQSSIDSSKG